MAFIDTPERKGEWRYGRVLASILYSLAGDGMDGAMEGVDRVKRGWACPDPQQAEQKIPSPLNVVCKTGTISSLLCSIVCELHYVS